MAPRKIIDGVVYVGASDWDRRLFDELIPLPDGTTYNAYIVEGSSATALIDTVDPEKTCVLMENLDATGINKIDYIVTNHAEQDHSGTLPAVLERYPDSRIVTSKKCAALIEKLLLVNPDRIQVVDDGDTLGLGGRTLEFIAAPWVHWPETMLTYLRENKMLFPCDLFGSHLATSDLYADDEARVYSCAKRYYAEIMMPFRSLIRKYLDRLQGYEIDIIAPSHGPLYRRPEFIIDAYREWTSETVKNEVVIPYVSMHGSVRKMTEYLADRLIERGITVKPFNLTVTDIGELAVSLVDTSTIVMGTPTVLTGPHPAAVYAVYLANLLRPKTRYLSVIGSYGWGGKMLDDIKALTGNLKAELIEPVVTLGYPDEQCYKALDRLADDIAEKHSTI